MTSRSTWSSLPRTGVTTPMRQMGRLAPYRLALLWSLLAAFPIAGGNGDLVLNVPTATAQAQPQLAPAARGHVTRLLAVYERIRAKLARDALAGVGKDAAMLRSAAEAARGTTPIRLQTHLAKLSAAAAALRKMSKQNEAAVRRAFGEVSRHTVALLVAEPGLRAGRHVFECPMASGYKKWIQTQDKIANPYMGTRMLACGARSQWKSNGWPTPPEAGLTQLPRLGSQAES